MRFRRPATLVAAAMLTVSTALAGCGAMLTPEQRAAVSGNGGSGSNGGSGGEAAGPGEAGGPGQAAGPGAAGGPSGAGPGGGAANSAAGPGGAAGGPGGAGGGVGGAAGCKGGASDKGITPTSIAIGNASDISGVVPSLYQGAQDATKAFAAYANANGGICGRQLDVRAYDTGETESGDKTAAQKGCDETFAMVGSMSAVDDGGAGTTSGCGEPDVRGMSQTKQRANNAPTTYPAHTYNATQWSTAGADYFSHKYPDAVKKAAIVYINQGTVQDEVNAWTKANQSRGWNFIYNQAIDVSDVNYSPYVLQMQNKGVQTVIFIGAAQHGVRMAKAMQQQGFKPQAYIVDQAIYGDEYVSSGGSAVDATYSELQTIPLEELKQVPEGQLYLQWLQKVKPGAKPTIDGVMAWSAARLFATEMAKLGPNPTRQALLGALAGVHDWNGLGLSTSMDVAGRKMPPCSMFVQVRGQRWTRDGPASGYACGSLVGV